MSENGDTQWLSEKGTQHFQIMHNPEVDNKLGQVNNELIVNYYFLIFCAKTVKTYRVKQWQRVLSKKLCEGLPITRESVER